MLVFAVDRIRQGVSRRRGNVGEDIAVLKDA